jgi:aspartyl protease family protein
MPMPPIDEHDLDLLPEEEPAQAGILSKTLRNLGIVAVVCITLSVVVGGLSEDVQKAATKANEAIAVNDQNAAGGDIDSASASELLIRANGAGHFLIDADVERAKIRFLVDTGATMVVLSPEDARRAGLSEDRLNFSREVSTANGNVRVAPVTLRKFKVGQIVLRDVEAVVNSAPMRVSLLGMSFLRRLDGWQVKGDKLYLAW